MEKIEKNVTWARDRNGNSVAYIGDEKIWQENPCTDYTHCKITKKPLIEGCDEDGVSFEGILIESKDYLLELVENLDA